MERFGVGAVSSVGRAPALHAGCHRFEPCTAQPSRSAFRLAGHAKAVRRSLRGGGQQKTVTVGELVNWSVGELSCGCSQFTESETHELTKFAFAVSGS